MAGIPPTPTRPWRPEAHDDPDPTRGPGGRPHRAGRACPPRRRRYLDLENQVQEFTLDNGVHFIVLEDHDVPVFSFRTFVRRGQRQRGPRHHRHRPTSSSTWPSRAPSEIGTNDIKTERKAMAAEDEAFVALKAERLKGEKADPEQARRAGSGLHGGQGRRPRVRGDQRVRRDRREQRRQWAERLHQTDVHPVPLQLARATGWSCGPTSRAAAWPTRCCASSTPRRTAR